MVQEFEVDFNDLARGGKVRVHFGSAPASAIGERVRLVETAEELALEAVLTEFDNGFAYFDLLPGSQSDLPTRITVKSRP